MALYGLSVKNVGLLKLLLRSPCDFHSKSPTSTPLICYWIALISAFLFNDRCQETPVLLLTLTKPFEWCLDEPRLGLLHHRPRDQSRTNETAKTCSHFPARDMPGILLHITRLGNGEYVVSPSSRKRKSMGQIIDFRELKTIKVSVAPPSTLRALKEPSTVFASIA